MIQIGQIGAPIGIGANTLTILVSKAVNAPIPSIVPNAAAAQKAFVTPLPPNPNNPSQPVANASATSLPTPPANPTAAMQLAMIRNPQALPSIILNTQPTKAYTPSQPAPPNITQTPAPLSSNPLVALAQIGGMAAQTLAGSAQTIVQGIQGTTNYIASGLQSTFQGVSQGLGQIGNTLSQGIQGTAQFLASGLSSTLGGIGKFFSNPILLIAVAGVAIVIIFLVIRR